MVNLLSHPFNCTWSEFYRCQTHLVVFPQILCFFPRRNVLCAHWHIPRTYVYQKQRLMQQSQRSRCKKLFENQIKSTRDFLILYFSTTKFNVSQIWRESFICCRAQFASVDEIHKEEIRREKRRYVKPSMAFGLHQRETPVRSWAEVWPKFTWDGYWMGDHLGKPCVVLLGWRSKWSSITPPISIIIECRLNFS